MKQALVLPSQPAAVTLVRWSGGQKIHVRRVSVTVRVVGLSRTLDDDGRFSTRTHCEIPANRRASVLLESLDHRECGRTRFDDRSQSCRPLPVRPNAKGLGRPDSAS